MSPRRIASLAALIAGLLVGARISASAADEAPRTAIVAQMHASGTPSLASDGIAPTATVELTAPTTGAHVLVAVLTPAAPPAATLPIYLRDRALRR